MQFHAVGYDITVYLQHVKAGEFMESECVAPQSWECDFGGQRNVFSDATQ